MNAEPLDPTALRPAYGRFLEGGRILLTGHSHQAWPDVAREAVLEAWDDAARLADDKWGRAFAKADAVRRAVTDRIGGDPDRIALGQSTHELVTRFLSALDLRARPHLVTTGGEFHSMSRQLGRLAEEGVEVTVVPVAPLTTLSARLAEAVRPSTAALLASNVLFQTSSVVPELEVAIAAAREVGAEVLVDAYHAFGVVPMSWPELGEVFVTGGGYKYAQWGEGVCFLGVPAGCALRPVYTGWFSDFGSLASHEPGDAIRYGARQADRFAGSTYDPVSHYRAAAVAGFFAEQGMSVERLAALYRRQTQRIIEGLEGFEILSPREPTARGGFVAVRVPGASEVVAALRSRDIFVDSRRDVLRLGPAPYVTDEEIDAALAAVRELVS